jgi:hypothetical protein
MLKLSKHMDDQQLRSAVALWLMVLHIMLTACTQAERPPELTPFLESLSPPTKIGPTSTGVPPTATPLGTAAATMVLTCPSQPPPQLAYITPDGFEDEIVYEIVVRSYAD